MNYQVDERELEVLTEAADAVYQRNYYVYSDIKKDKIKRKHIADVKPKDMEDDEKRALIEKVDYIKLYNSNDGEKNDKYYKPKAITGFKYAVYQKKDDKNKIILAYAGTDRKASG